MAPPVAPPPPPPQTIFIRLAADAIFARRAAKTYAQTLGFCAEACEEIALAAAELATNLCKHAGSGDLVLRPASAGGRAGLQIESHDQGPGIANINESLADGFSTSSSLGIGLGTVNRLLDELEITSHPGRGTHLIGRKWIRPSLPPVIANPLGVGVATRAKSGENGDDFVIKKWGSLALVGVIDGCGHGLPAHRAARAARLYIENHSDLPLEQIFAGVERTCRGTRGVVMALARIDTALRSMEFASVGNISARLVGTAEPFPFVIRRGIIGVNAPRPVPTVHAWGPTHILALHSDGVASAWDDAEIQRLPAWTAEIAARELLRSHAKLNDDATVLVAKNKIS